jgi:hypothetical protein
MDLDLESRIKGTFLRYRKTTCGQKTPNSFRRTERTIRFHAQAHNRRRAAQRPRQTTRYPIHLMVGPSFPQR